VAARAPVAPGGSVRAAAACAAVGLALVVGAACGGGTGPGAGVSPRPSVSASAPAGSPRPTRQPATEAPTAPPTQAPTAPPTQAPTARPTLPPTTAPTAPPTAAPTSAPTAAPTAAPQPSASPAAGSVPISPWWWVAIAAALIGLAIGGVVIWRRLAARNAWQDQVTKVTTELRWVDEQLIPGMLAAPTAAAFAQAWTDGRPRLVAADQQLFALGRSAPDDTRSGSVSRLRSAVGELIRAIDVEAGLTSPDPDALRAARAAVERARLEFSSALDAVEPSP
jgi:hypothetical protein